MPRRRKPKTDHAPHTRGPGDFPMPQPVQFTPPATYGNSTTTEPYRAPAWNVRPGADDHKQYRSRGF